MNSKPNNDTSDTPECPSQIGIALKEWAVVQRSLLEGRQILLLRKGGLIEETGEFDLRAPWFFLFPTYVHETERAGDVQPAYHHWLSEEEAQKPPRNLLRFEAFAHATDIVEVRDRSILLNIASEHLWSDQFIQGRFDWEPYKPVFALLLRVYSLPNPTLTPMRPDYGGCRSWIHLDTPISTHTAHPALADQQYTLRRQSMLQALLPTE